MRKIYLGAAFASFLVSAPALAQTSVPLTGGAGLVGANSGSTALATPGGVAGGSSVASTGGSGFGNVSTCGSCTGQTGGPGQVTGNTPPGAGAQGAVSAQSTPGGAAIAASTLVTQGGAAFTGVAGSVGGQGTWIISTPTGVGANVGNTFVGIPRR